MVQDTFVLYVDSQFISPYAMSAFVTLTEKGVPFELKQVDLEANEHCEVDYAALSLTCRVPTLVHENFGLAESSAISEYLDELFPAPQYVTVYPSEIRHRAIARQIQAWLRSDLMPIREERPTTTVFLQQTGEPLSEAARASAAKLFSAADRLLKDDALSLFDSWCIADTDLALMLNRLVQNGDDVPEKLAKYTKYQWQRPSIQSWLNRAR